MTKRPIPTSGMAFRGERRKGGRMNNLVFNCAITVVSLVGLILIFEVEPVWAMMSSLLLGIFFTLMDIYLELKRRK